MKIYISGHRGLVGSAIHKTLQGKGYKDILCRTSRDLDLRRQSDTERFFETERPQHVYLAAAKVGGILANNTYKADFIYDNMAIALNVIHAAYKYGTQKLLNLGSSCIYPRLAPQPIKEEYLLTGILESTNEPYAVAKIAAIKLCRYYNEQHGTNFISVMPTNLFGPADNFNLETAHVLPSLIRKFHLAKLLQKRDFEGIKKDIEAYPLGFGVGFSDETHMSQGSQWGMKIEGRVVARAEGPKQSLNVAGFGIASHPPDARNDNAEGFSSEKSIEVILNGLGITKDHVLLWGSGEPYREFLYVDDLADACVFLMENYDYRDIGELVNVGMGEDIKIKELANLIQELVGFDGEIKHDLSRPDGTPRKLLDISIIKSLGWVPKTNLKEGLRKTYEWYGKNGER